MVTVLIETNYNNMTQSIVPVYHLTLFIIILMYAPNINRSRRTNTMIILNLVYYTKPCFYSNNEVNKDS